jgi:hypothetical protein
MAAITFLPSDPQLHVRHALERSNKMTFNRVELHEPNGQVLVLTPEEFRALPAVDRVQWIGQGRFRFFLDEQKVRPVDALRANRQPA